MPLNPASGYSLTLPSARFYGGASTRWFNTTNLPGFSDSFVRNDAANDFFGFRAQSHHAVSVAFVWLKEDFLEGAEVADHPVSLSAESRFLLRTGGNRWEQVFGRWLVREAGQWYVSEAALATGLGDKALTFADDFDHGRWAAVDLADAPLLNLDLDSLVYATRTFTDLTGFGVYLENDDLAGGRLWFYIREFRIEAAVTVPLPLTPLQAWRQTHFGISDNTGLAANDADPLGKGLPNLLAFALGAAPLDPADRPAVLWQATGGTLSLTFTPAVTAGLQFAVELSENLTDWTTLTNITALLEVDIPFTFAHPLPAHPPRPLFLRLRVTEE